jgi:hypothetical protein
LGDVGRARFLAGNRFNMRMSRLVHARLFIDVLRD